MVFCQVFSNVSIAYRGDGWWDGGRVQWVGMRVAKNPVRTPPEQP